jgi:hypothetical protein
VSDHVLHCKGSTGLQVTWRRPPTRVAYRKLM